jgi:two-component system sensor histidine kinase MprB
VSLRTRLTLAGGGAVFVALAIASLVIYVEVRAKLHDQIDVALIQAAQNIATKWENEYGPTPVKVPAGKHRRTGKLPAGQYRHGKNPTFPQGPYFGSNASGYFQIVPSLGEALKGTVVGIAGTSVSTVTTSTSTQTTATSATKIVVGKAPPALQVASPNRFVPLLKQDALVADGLSPPYFRDVRYRGVAMRLYTLRLSSSGDGLVRTARALTEANATITRVRWLLLGLTIGGALAAALLGRLTANAVLRPVRALAGATREVTATRNLDRRIPVTGRDELASLASDFNAMLAALEESQRAQQQLIADASHELRTPLTAHRANVELLARADLPPERRRRVLGAAVRGIEELSALVGDLIEAARNGKAVDNRAELALDALVTGAVDRARQRAPELRFETRLEPSTLAGSRTRVERAIDNVLDNAAKWSPSEGTVEVALDNGSLTVRDHGPGIDPGDLPHVFDRFYRSAAARALPGSGLGLAIVKQTVDDHGGSVTIENAAGGGVLVTMQFGSSPDA